jgi:hypothetical protein
MKVRTVSCQDPHNDASDVNVSTTTMLYMQHTTERQGISSMSPWVSAWWQKYQLLVVCTAVHGYPLQLTISVMGVADVM